MKKLFIALLIVLVAIVGVGVYFVMSGRYSEPSFTISVIESEGGGTVSVDKTDANAGDKVKLTITPESGYKLVEGSLKYGDTEIELDKDNSFKMPSENIVIKYEFALIEYNINYMIDEHTSVEGLKTTYTKKSETLELGEPSKSGYIFDGWYLDNNHTKKVTSIESGTTGNYYLYPKFIALFQVSNGHIEGFSDYLKNLERVDVLEIPERIDGVTIDGIADEALISGANISKLEIPNTVKYFGVNCFGFGIANNFNEIEYVGSLNDWVESTFKDYPIIHTQTLKIDGKEIGESLNLPTSIKKVSANAFYGFEQLEYVFYDGSIDEYAKIEFENEYASPMHCAEKLHINGYYVAGEITISGTTSIYPGAFANCEGITSVKFNIESPMKMAIKNSAFENCSNLKDVEMDKVIFIEDNAFFNCTKLQVETLSFVAHIGAYAFYNCDSITKLELGISGGVTIGDSAFDDCSALKDLVIVNVATIGKRSFRDCALTGVMVNGGLTTIGDGAFAGNQGISVNLSKCTSTIQAGKNVFDDCGNFKVWFASEALANQYKTAENWSEYADKLFYMAG